MGTREDCTHSFMAKLHGWRSHLSSLAEGSQSIGPQQKDRFRSTIQRLSDQIQHLEKKVLVLENAADDSWRDLSRHVEDAWKDFQADAKASLKSLTGKEY